MNRPETSDQFLNILKTYWGYNGFRSIQRDIIESIAKGNDTLGLMPTGGGKSITFQVPALAKDGVCLVITPLIALMKDQVQHLRQLGIRADAIYTGMSRTEIVKTLENAIFGGVKFLYVSPERLSSPLFLNKLKRIKLCFITVDEAHCISQWGYDFRPSYLHISDIRKLKPDAPILALTATATPEVIDDIQERLDFKKKNVFRMSFERKNLAYVVRDTNDKPGQLIHILKSVKGSAIVYVRSRIRCKKISDLLEENGISSTYYHAGLEQTVKDQRQQEWQEDKKRIMVATNAFGMGIDKPDVRLVIHYDSPDTVEAYFQEAGRAGRDGKKAYAVLLWGNTSDIRKLHTRIEATYPPKDFIRDVYEHLAYFFEIGVGSGSHHLFQFNLDLFCHNFKYFPTWVDSALNLLTSAGYIRYERDPEAQARLKFTIDRHELYRLNEGTPIEDAVITTVLRLYAGVFTDYVFIDEALIALRSGATRDQVYQTLKSLSNRHILHFIPQRKTPSITYLQDRVDAEDIILDKDIYDDRKEMYRKHIEAMIEYASNNSVCRSRMLLRYFGEMDSHDCHVCDVCLNNKFGTNKNRQTNQVEDLRTDQEDSIKKKILGLLADGQKHDIKEFTGLMIPQKQIGETLQYLINEEEIHVDGTFLFIENN
ncbi:MAG: RecQ family ATP-dependent DNA helicase [Prevotella sp.]|jgi:ATP-dependent DNA helicase RecQ